MVVTAMLLRADTQMPCSWIGNRQPFLSPLGETHIFAPLGETHTTTGHVDRPARAWTSPSTMNEATSSANGSRSIDR